VPCSGRVDPLFVVKAFQDGADGVMILGCHPGDCHYQQGNYFAQRRYALMHRLLEFIGIETDRLFVEWVSASEGKKFADVVTAFTERVRDLGPAAIKRPQGTAFLPSQTISPQPGCGANGEVKA
jgi:F420-non-reducing hydrogenase iron-sulfur subunit